jgi:hypothetical protein
MEEREREREKSGSADTASVLLSFLPYAIHPSSSIAPKTIFLLGDRGRQFGEEGGSLSSSFSLFARQPTVTETVYSEKREPLKT